MKKIAIITALIGLVSYNIQAKVIIEKVIEITQDQEEELQVDKFKIQETPFFIDKSCFDMNEDEYTLYHDIFTGIIFTINGKNRLKSFILKTNNRFDYTATLIINNDTNNASLSNLKKGKLSRIGLTEQNINRMRKNFGEAFETLKNKLPLKTNKL